jgi:hypothetical protein
MNFIHLCCSKRGKKRKGKGCEFFLWGGVAQDWIRVQRKKVAHMKRSTMSPSKGFEFAGYDQRLGLGGNKGKNKMKENFPNKKPRKANRQAHQKNKKLNFLLNLLKKKKKTLQDTTYPLISQDPKILNYCTTQIGHLELKNKSNKKTEEICQNFKIRRRVVSFFWGAHMEENC